MLILGMVIYCLMSPDVFFLQWLSERTGFPIHKALFPADNAVMRLVRNYGPDMLWGYALVFALFFLQDNHTVFLRRTFWTAFLFSAGMEMLQILPGIHGTFDWLDICAEFFAEIFAVFIIKKHNRGGS